MVRTFIQLARRIGASGASFQLTQPKNRSKMAGMYEAITTVVDNPYPIIFSRLISLPPTLHWKARLHPHSSKYREWLSNADSFPPGMVSLHNRHTNYRFFSMCGQQHTPARALQM
jgi:hypothetical protein